MESVGSVGRWRPAEIPVQRYRKIEIEKSLTFDQGLAELTNFTWERQCTDVWTSSGYFFNLCVSRRPGPAQIRYVGNGRRVFESAGRLLFIPNGKEVETVASSGSLRALTCHLSPATIEDLLPSPPDWPDAALADSSHLDSPQVEFFMQQVYRELQQPGFASAVLVESLLQAMAVALIRWFNLEHGAKRNSFCGGLAGWQMKRIVERVHSEERVPSLSELADLCGISVRHLSRTFKAETGMTVARYVEHAMVERACQLISSSDLPLNEVAAKLGFSRVGGFSFAFRRATGVRPSEYRVRFKRREAVFILQ